MAKRMKRPGGPEWPLSKMGEIAFHTFWRETLIRLIGRKGEG
jgi:hypothetical protein